jgi:hypothetical protein
MILNIQGVWGGGGPDKEVRLISTSSNIDMHSATNAT